MPIKHRLEPVPLSEKKHLKTLVENRKSFTLEQCELNIFETHTQSHLVPLTFNDLVVTSMLRGKKVMHLLDQSGFDYLPGETVIVPPNVTMKIDFPDATENNPTQCIALAIDHRHIDQTLHYLNEHFPRAGEGEAWKLDYDHYHFSNNVEVAHLINKLIRICMARDTGKDILADLALKELLVRIMQTQHINSAAGDELMVTANRSPMAYIMTYIRENIHEKIQITDLSNKACMSKATFYRVFKREFGISPLEYILLEKMARAKELLANPAFKISAISDELGFSDVNYFIRLFKKMEGITPNYYRQTLLQKSVA